MIKQDGPYYSGDVDLPSDPTMTMRPRPRYEAKAADGTAAPASVAGEVPDEGGVPPAHRGFSLLRLIGRGGHGEVWEARQESLGRIVAVKRLPPDETGENGPVDSRESSPEEMEQAFRQEALITAHLEHPNIVPVHDLGVDEEGKPVLAMKLLRGQPWDRMIADDFDRLDSSVFLARHLPILADVAQAVAFAHARGVVHRDLKPSQVVVGEFGESLLMDWGLAVVFDCDALLRGGAPSQRRGKKHGGNPPPGFTAAVFHGVLIPTLDVASNPAGTPAYMAPEQTESTAGRIGPWTDVYLLGGILYYLLTGTPPHGTGNSRAAFERAKAGWVEHPAKRCRRRPVPPDLANLAMEALQPNPEERFQGGARAFVRAIQDYMSGATRQRESEALVRLVASRLRGARGDYEALTELSGLLDNARALWPENPEVALLRERVLEETVEAAIAHRDLTLARVHVARLEPGATKRQLLRHVDAMEAAVKRQERQRRASVRAVGALVVLLAIMAALDFDARHSEARERLALAFDRAASSEARALGRALTRALDIVHATAGLFAASGVVSPQEFATFTRPLLARQREVLTLEWIPRIPLNARIDFELAVRRESWPSFTIFEIDERGTTAPASLRPFYYPVIYAEPSEDPGNRAALGYDMGSSVLRLEAMTKAWKTLSSTATGRLRLVQDPDGPYGFLVFVPVFYANQPVQTESQRRDALLGFVAAVLRPVDLLEQAALTSQAPPIAVDLYDDTAPRSQSRLVMQGSGLRDERVPSEMRYETSLEIAGRRWQFVATPTAQFLAENHLPRQPWTLFVGAVVILALAVYIASDLHESRRIARLAQGPEMGD